MLFTDGITITGSQLSVQCALLGGGICCMWWLLMWWLGPLGHLLAAGHISKTARGTNRAVQFESG
jgi:hypothetical protein